MIKRLFIFLCIGFIPLNLFAKYKTITSTITNVTNMYLDGSIAIGTTNFAENQLLVIGSATFSGTIVSSGIGNNSFAGNVGIGVDVPTNKLDVLGSVDIDGDLVITGTITACALVVSTITNDVLVSTYLATDRMYSNKSTSITFCNEINMLSNNIDTEALVDGVDISQLQIDSTTAGVLIGINASSSTYAVLRVDELQSTTQYFILGSSVEANIYNKTETASYIVSTSAWTTDGTNIWSNKTGNVGIGTAVPDNTLNVIGNISATGIVFSSGGFYGDGSNITGILSTGVVQIIAGTNITITPTDGHGIVTVNSSGGTGGAGDNLGNHIATMTVNLDGNDMINGSTVQTDTLIVSTIIAGSPLVIQADSVNNIVGGISVSNLQGVLRGQYWTESSREDYGGGAHAWTGLAISSSGRIQTCAMNSGEGIFVSTNYGVNFVRISTFSNAFSCIAMSDDGSIQTIGTHDGDIFVSTDSGNNFYVNYNVSGGNLYDVAVSSDGEIQSIVDYNSGYIYRSIDYGVTWSQTVSPQQAWTCIAMTKDGQNLSASASMGNIYISTCAGLTWIQKTAGIYTHRTIAMSDNTNYQTLCGSSYIWITTCSWTTYILVVNNLEGSGLSDVAMSIDGKYQSAARTGGYAIMISTDYGYNWFNSEQVGVFGTIVMSDDGWYQTALSEGEPYIASQNPIINTNTNISYLNKDKFISKSVIANVQQEDLVAYSSTTINEILSDGQVTWVDPENILLPDEQYAVSTLTSEQISNRYISSECALGIPENATVTGVTIRAYGDVDTQVTVNAKLRYGDLLSDEVQAEFLNGGGSTDPSFSSEPGGDFGELTAEKINSPDFGFEFYLSYWDYDSVTQFDYTEVTVSYTLPTLQSWQHGLMSEVINGNVGIGVSNPASKLQVDGTILPGYSEGNLGEGEALITERLNNVGSDTMYYNEVHCKDVIDHSLKNRNKADAVKTVKGFILGDKKTHGMALVQAKKVKKIIKEEKIVQKRVSGKMVNEVIVSTKTIEVKEGNDGTS